MNTLKSNVFQRLLLQAEELKERGLEKTAANVIEALEDTQVDVDREYSYVELQEDLNADLWKAATRFISYYNVENPDVEKIQKALSSIASVMISDMEWALDTNYFSGNTLEPKVPGEK